LKAIETNFLNFTNQLDYINPEDIIISLGSSEALLLQWEVPWIKRDEIITLHLLCGFSICI
jgi:hypothetical protein